MPAVRYECPTNAGLRIRRSPTRQDPARLGPGGPGRPGRCKTRDGTSRPDRNAQFEHINGEVKTLQTAGEPVISVDTKEKERVGDFENGGRELLPKDQPEPV
jgi:hypothetical protein